jgi:hypothetical protein
MIFKTHLFIACAVVLGVLGSLASAADPPPPIYGEDSKPVGLTLDSQKIIVGVLTIMIFVCMVLNVASPEVVMFTALIICLLLQILTLPETLSGKYNPQQLCYECLFKLIFSPVTTRIFQRINDYHWRALHCGGSC